MRSVLVGLTVAIAVLAGCGSSSSSTGDDGVTGSEPEVVDNLDRALVLPDLAGEPDLKARKRVDPRLAKLAQPEDRYFLDVSFGRLDEARFATLAKFFGGATRVRFEPDRSYELVDFLHPAIQAVVNTTFQTGRYPGEKLKAPGLKEKFADEATFEILASDGIGVFTNCYNTTSEIVRMQHPSVASVADPTFNFYFPDRFKADEWFSRDDLSQKVAEADRRPGDVLVVRQPQESFADNAAIVIHTAIIVSKEILFEKTDSTDEDPYRLSLRKDVIAKLDRVAGKPLPLIVEYRRFNLPGKPAIPTTTAPTNELEPHQREALAKAYPEMNPANVTLSTDLGFGGGFAPETNEIVSAKVVLDPKTGRGKLSGAPAVLGHFVRLAAE